MLSYGFFAVLISGVYSQTIDLGYARYSPSSTNVNVTTYNNIRYAAPPVGTLRFVAPQAPIKETTVNDGSVGYTCPVAYPQNSLVTSGYDSNRKQSEDCLFLDVYVPTNVSSTAGLPVMVWLHGGGFTTGSKDLYPGYGLLQASGQSMIFVAANYRLGAMGWSAGPTYGSQGGIANLGLLDQRFALDWVQSQIAKFGGDPTQVTVAGESAGGSSIMFHIVAKGGTLKPTFQRAIAQSPAVLPEFQSVYLEAIYQNFTTLAGCPDMTLKCLQSASSESIIAASKKQIENNPNFSTFVYGPSVDYGYVAALPTAEFLSGKAFKIPMLLSFNGNESAIFANPKVTTDAQFNSQLAQFLPNLSTNAYAQIAAQYPISDYTSQYARLSQFIDDSLVGCNVRAMAASNPSNSYVYEFNVGTAHHGSDILYTFLNSFSVTSAQFGLNAADIAVAELMQQGITSFVINGNPGISNYASAQIKVLTETSITDEHDPNDNSRCDFLEKASYDPNNALLVNASAAMSASGSSTRTSTAASRTSSTATATATTQTRATTTTTATSSGTAMSYSRSLAWLSTSLVALFMCQLPDLAS